MQTNHHVGRLSRLPKFYIRGEKQMQIAYFTLAINDLKENNATFIDYVAFGKTAELVRDQLSEKGQLVDVVFNMRNHNYTDKTTGQKHYEIQNVVTLFSSHHTQKQESHAPKAIGKYEPNETTVVTANHEEYPVFDENNYDFFGGTR
ncbi:single-stranded DNA-binding protein [Leuconostoc citreum]|uniref:single-stranded DNA-binding protein n=1 Tax=Leuconostoc citreum TaxID=33964 RepID=UPI00200A50EF|nr:single-stranded DNA-binding protein [Leuconostoc citreum]MCK8605711.1 single-stranded DNA-binding protein [Leuconostoc citreum]